MGNKQSSFDANAKPNKNNLLQHIQASVHDFFHPPPSPPPKPRAPKHMLWGCETVEDHYQRIRDACAMAADQHGKRGLAALGFEFRMLHHPDRCSCGGVQFEIPPLAAEDCSSGDHGEEQEEDANECFLVPTGTPISEHELDDSESPVVETPSSSNNNNNNNKRYLQRHESTSHASTRRLNRVASAVSMFSLATHHTYTSSSDSFLEDDDDDENDICCLRLFHKSSNTLLTPENHETFVAHGRMYDEVARLCMEYAQDVMKEEGKLEWNTVGEDIQVLASSSTTLTTDEQERRRRRRKVLLVVTGKGLVRAGIFSRRHILTTGIESATALPMVREALKRDMEIVMLDPNAKGWRNGMVTVEKSLEQLFLPKHEEDVYVVAHSMAGSQLVRYLHNKTMAAKDTTLLTKIKAIAFTDSNHNINWTKDNPAVTDLLVGPASLYIKSHKVHEDAKALGEVHHDCDFWRHRFGDIRTLWAGTNEHALTNYTARFPIWEHFDFHLQSDDGFHLQSDDGLSF